MSVTSLDILDSVKRVAAVLPPLRRELLARLAEPQSATTLAHLTGMARQKVNYHLKELERGGFVELVEERRRRGCVERVFKATADRYLVIPHLLCELASEPGPAQDRFSSAYLIVAAARLMRDVAVLRRRAQAVSHKLATFTLEVDVGFASPAALRAFTNELAGELARLASKYGQEGESVRSYRFVVGGHPIIMKTEDEAAVEAAAEVTIGE